MQLGDRATVGGGDKGALRAESTAFDDRCRELERRCDQMREQIATLRQELERLDAERGSLLAAQVNLLKDLARDLLPHRRVGPDDTPSGKPVERFVRHARKLVGGIGSSAARKPRTEAMLAQIQSTLDELLRMAQALVISSTR